MLEMMRKSRVVSQAVPGRRLDELIAASGERRLTAEEQLEFQELLNQRRPPGNTPG